MSFDPNSYDVPEKVNNYMKFQEGENRFRILEQPIRGYLYWVDADHNILPKGSKAQKGNVPVRIKVDDTLTVEMVEAGAKHFWAMPVWNYTTNNVQILEITQKGIQKDISTYARNLKWGSPTEYDLVVTRTGVELDTEYSVLAEPKEKLSEDVVAKYKAMDINMDALFEGADPFAGSKEELVKEVSLDDIEAPF